MRKVMPAGWKLPAVSLGLAVCVGALAQSVVTLDPGSQVALQNLLNQSFEVKAVSTNAAGVQTLYLQRQALLYACPLNVAGLACSRVLSR
jgi:hypothetical protein